MTETKHPLKVFLCHTSQDKPAVRELYQRLADEGWIDPWMDERRLLPGQDWRTKIEEAVETSDNVIICLSSNSVGKEGFIQKELRYAREISFEKPEETIFLIPLRLDDCVVPRGLRFIQWGDYFGKKKDETYAALLEALKVRFEQKLKLDEAELARQEKERLEQEGTEKADREIREKTLAEKARLTGVEQERQIAKRKQQEATDDLHRKRLVQNKTFVTVALIGLLVIVVAVLTVEKWFSPVPALTETLIPTVTLTNKPITPIVTFTLMPGPAASTPPVENEQVDCFYTIREGDNLFGVAERFGIGGNNSNLIRSINGTAIVVAVTPGQMVIIPNVLRDICLKEGGLQKEKNSNGVLVVLIPAGEFIMGSDSGYVLEKPAHSVDLDNYYIDKYEVTNALYKTCVKTGICEPPADLSKYNDLQYEQHPVTYVNWMMAKVYCEWHGGRLPTEAEWEKAARGAGERTFPWGETLNSTYVNFSSESTEPVGSYPNGVSPFGLYDMAGNVWEWVSSMDNQYPYDPNDGRENLTIPGNRILRGGGWDDTDTNRLKSYYRSFGNSERLVRYDVGFRCAYGIP